MPLYLVNPAVEMTLELYLPQGLEEALTRQYERIQDRQVRATFERRLEARLERLLADCIDWDLKKPTDAQLSYAEILAKRLGVEVPSEVRSSRYHAALFLETYSRLSPDNEGVKLTTATGADLARELACSKAEKDSVSSDQPKLMPK